jgi:hypothetical protein
MVVGAPGVAASVVVVVAAVGFVGITRLCECLTSSGLGASCGVDCDAVWAIVVVVVVVAGADAGAGAGAVGAGVVIAVGAFCAGPEFASTYERYRRRASRRNSMVLAEDALGGDTAAASNTRSMNTTLSRYRYTASATRW